MTDRPSGGRGREHGYRHAAEHDDDHRRLGSDSGFNAGSSRRGGSRRERPDWGTSLDADSDQAGGGRRERQRTDLEFEAGPSRAGDRRSEWSGSDSGFDADPGRRGGGRREQRGRRRSSNRAVESRQDGDGADAAASESAGGGEAAARRIALDALSRAARTRGQLEALLQRKGIAPEAAEAVLDRFEEVGLIDDVGYSEAFVESRHRIRGQGGRALSAELRRRGVADDVVADAVGALDPEQEFETACRIARARYDRMPAVAAEVKLRRLAGFLARKGYSGAIVSRAVRHVVQEAAAEEQEAAEAAAEAFGDFEADDAEFGVD
ncbi:MAG TPA: regulatory protein RecX [Actinocrinis sp.]|nr:regulatory protein RecX [Actinocrinis sp.]HZU56230.1 regulatory protein RecX [Actinocrinis sp.]